MGLELPPIADLNTDATASSRRSFLGRGVATAAAGTALVGASASTASAQATSLPANFRAQASRLFQQIQLDESTHVNIIVAAIQSLGGTPRPFPTFTGITNLSLEQFLQTSVAFENTGVGAYLGAAAYVQNPAVLNVALSIYTVEARHSGFLNSASNITLTPNGLPYATPLTIAQITAAVSPFIVSLNDNGQFPATFSTTPSAANDIAILNFALLLEYLEAAFYFYNVPRLLGRSGRPRPPRAGVPARAATSSRVAARSRFEGLAAVLDKTPFRSEDGSPFLIRSFPAEESGSRCHPGRPSVDCWSSACSACWSPPWAGPGRLAARPATPRSARPSASSGQKSSPSWRVPGPPSPHPPTGRCPARKTRP